MKLTKILGSIIAIAALACLSSCNKEEEPEGDGGGDGTTSISQQQAVQELA